MSTTTSGLSALSAGAQKLVQDPANLIDGAWEPGEGEGRLVALNPTTTELLAEIPVA